MQGVLAGWRHEGSGCAQIGIGGVVGVACMFLGLPLQGRLGALQDTAGQECL